MMNDITLNEDELRPLDQYALVQPAETPLINTLGNGHLSSSLLTAGDRSVEPLHHTTLMSLGSQGATVHALGILAANVTATSSELFFNDHNLPHLMMEESELLSLSNLTETQGKQPDLMDFHHHDEGRQSDLFWDLHLSERHQSTRDIEITPQPSHSAEAHQVAAEKLHSTLNDHARAMPHDIDYHAVIHATTSVTLIDATADVHQMPNLRALQSDTSTSDVSSLSMDNLLVVTDDALFLDASHSPMQAPIDLDIMTLDESTWHQPEIPILAHATDTSASEMSNLIEQLLLCQQTDITG